MLPAKTTEACSIKNMLFKQGNYIFKEIPFMGNTKIRMHGNGLTARGTKITVNIKWPIFFIITGYKLNTGIPPMSV